MSFLKRKSLMRLTLLATILLVSLTGFLLLRDREETYRPGERTDGLIDTLARELPPGHPSVMFKDVAAEVGLTHTHFGATRTNRLPEDMGSGVAVGDIDGDGWPDLYFANKAGNLDGKETGWADSTSIGRLYRNRGDGNFEDVTKERGLEFRDLSMGASFLDHDGDGDLDLIVSSYGRLRFFENDGRGYFEDVSTKVGVEGFDGFWTGLAVGDPDADEDIDIYVCGYVQYSESLGGASRVARQYGLEIPALINPSTFPPERNLYFRNRGDGTFEEVAADLGIDNPKGRSLAAVITDLSGDGRADIYVANDVSDNAFYYNEGETFTDRTHRALIGDYRGAMGIAVDDYDGDLDVDFFVTHWVAQENALYSNVTSDLEEEGDAPDVMFFDEADRFGLGQIALDMVGWATSFMDFDRDGQRDLVVINGGTIPTPDDDRFMRPMPTQLFWNMGDQKGFFELGCVGGEAFTEPIVGRGGAVLDYDLDGREDILVVCHGQPPKLLRNENPDCGNAIHLRLRQQEGNRFALGSYVHVEYSNRKVMGLTDAQGSYLSQHVVGDISFGLGASKRVDRIQITWPDGTQSEAGPFEAGHLVEWTKGSKPTSSPLPGLRAAMIEGPQSVDAKRRFFSTLDEASRARIAGRFEDAIVFYEQALVDWPAHEDSLYYLGNCLVELNREESALQVFRRMTSFFPQSSRAWMQLGRLYLPGGDSTLGSLKDARAAFEQSHRINAEESGPLIQLGLVSLLEGNLEEAETRLANATMLNPRSVEATYLRGWIAWQQGDAEGAEGWLQQAHALAAHTGAGDSVSNEGDTKDGQAMMSQREESASTAWERWKTIAHRQPHAESEYSIAWNHDH